MLKLYLRMITGLLTILGNIFFVMTNVVMRVNISVSGVTLYYLASPYLVSPHPEVTRLVEEHISERSPASKVARLRAEEAESFWSSLSGDSGQQETLYVLENWTKWTLRLRNERDEEQTLVKPQSFAKLQTKVTIPFSEY